MKAWISPDVARIGRPVLRQIGPWVVFLVFFAWGWRVRNPFTHVPAYGDVLEVLWGIEWYYDSILVHHSSPLFTSLVFHPLGWHPATLAFTPVLFALSLPLRALSSTAFTYNALAVLSLVIGFAGTFRFIQLFTSRPGAMAGAAVFIFEQACFFRISGQLSIAWMLSLLPWMARELELARRSQSSWARHLAIAGAIWGAIIKGLVAQ